MAKKKKKTVNGWHIAGYVVGGLLALFLVGVILYYSVPSVKAWTDEKILNKTEQEQVEDKEQADDTQTITDGQARLII